MLYPRESETRELKDLCGIWEFKVDRKGSGRRERWQARPLVGTIPMPVPSSYNDITQDSSIRDHIGEVWYERTFVVPASWEGKRVVLRFGSVTHHATVWVNGREAVSHKGGYLPFEADISAFVSYGAANRVSLAVSNVLDGTCIPPGKVVADKYEWGTVTWQDYWFDFFSYSGIHRAVTLYTTPRAFIEDVTVRTDIKGATGIVSCDTVVGGGRRNVHLRLLDASGREVASGSGARCTLEVRNARFWAPGAAYLYTLEVTALNGGSVEDVYRLSVGIRTVAVKGGRFLINGAPFYFKGVCKHEDADIRGKGLDHALNVKDCNLMKWMGANSLRTSHYPYSEEFMDLADREGFAVIDESPAVGCNFWDRKEFYKPGSDGVKRLAHHVDVMRDLVARDKNHPCVVMWSVANEPASDHPSAREYFRRVVAATRKCDATRPVTMVMCRAVQKEQAGDFLDVVCVNKYNSWYWYPGRLEIAEPSMLHELRLWHKRFRKPVFLTEFGADTIEGFHSDPPVIFSEEYQKAFYERYCAMLDKLDFIIGEHVWNFADFLTKQGITRVGGNRKGVFTRQRQPKMAAHFLRERWTKMETS
ncbi:beta-glucuronidase [bacterium]|nr:beta-glucuronidase [bacterium]